MRRRLTGRKGAGIKYERDLAACLPQAQHGQWFRFRDRSGEGLCQPDLLLRTPVGVAILEAKYTWTEQGHQQVDRLYAPVVARALGCRTFGLVVCRVLTPEVEKIWVRQDLESALAAASAGCRVVFHWLGVSLGPLQLRPGVSHLAFPAA